MEQSEKNSKHTLINISIILLVLMSIANAINPHLFWEHFKVINYPLHSTMEAMGALAAIIMGLISIRYLIEVKECRYEIISLSLLAMGCWDLFHAFLYEGKGFVFTHSLSLLLGGFFFFLIVINWSKVLVNNNLIIKMVLLIVIALLGVAIAVNNDKLPNMVNEYGHQGAYVKGEHFTGLANWMNIIAGVFFLIGTFRIYFDYLKHRKLGLLLLVLLGIQSASAGFLFPYSHSWADSWWFWHILRFLAFIGILTFMISQFARILNERTQTLKAMQESENKFTKLFDSEPDALFIANAKTGIITDVNDAAVHLMKAPKSSLIGRSQMELHPPEKRQEIAMLFREIAVNGSKKPQQVVIQDNNGKIIPVEIVGNVVRLGDEDVAIGIFRDVSERNALEYERNALSFKFQKIIELVPLPLCILDENNGDFRFFNRAFTKMFGYSEEDLKNVSDWWERAYPDESYRREVIENWNNAVLEASNKNQEIMTDVYRVTCKDGKIHQVMIGGIVIEGELLVTFIDLTEIREAEEIMKKQQQQLTAMFNGLDDVVYVSDIDTYELIYVNDVFKKAWGDFPEGSKCYKILQGRTSPCPFCTNKKILDNPGEAYIWEFQNEVTKKWYRCFDKVIEWSDGRLVRFELAIDITEMKLTEQAIIDEKTIFESTIDSLPGVFYQINTEGNYERWNKRFLEVTGYNDEEMSKIHALDFFKDEEKEAVAKAIENVFKKGEAIVESDLVLKSGKSIPYMFNGRMFVIKDKPYLIGMGMDISRLKKVEISLRQSNKELESFNSLAIGREKRMIELKKMINELAYELNGEEKFDLSFTEDLEGEES